MLKLVPTNSFSTTGIVLKPQIEFNQFVKKLLSVPFKREEICMNDQIVHKSCEICLLEIK